MRRPCEWALLSLLLLPLGCAAQYEEPAGTAPDSTREQAGAAEPGAAMDMEEPAKAERAESPDRSLDDIALELASNEAKLRALGVELPPRDTAGRDTNLGGETPPAPEPTAAGGASGGITSKPSAAPGKGGGRNRPAKKNNDDKDAADRFAPPPSGRPEEAKSAPLSPTEQPQLDAATRCIQVCELSEITCELGVQICELAQRHAEDRDYERACARATEDCDAAQEACDVCAG